MSVWEFDGPALPDDVDGGGFGDGFDGDVEDVVDALDRMTDAENES